MIPEPKSSIDFHPKKRSFFYRWLVSSKLAVKMLFSSIVVITLILSNILSTLSTDDKNVTDGKKMKEKPTENSILLLTMRHTKK